MGKAIAILTGIVLCSFMFVLLQLRPRGRVGVAAAAGRPAPLLETREDGSVYAVSIQMSKFEQRLIDAEKRSDRLGAQVDALRKQRDDLQEQVDDLQDEVQRLRRQLAGRSQPAQPAQPDQPAPAPTPHPPVTHPAPSPTPEGTPP